ncbi:uncharacterized protein CLUP02_00967 [Colletotrichum lupini]|uniref:Uncharacterized protein n=1 Tax=Colletotrichum lupini TaxID=145971 RepID=A0A9Q8W8Q5_9PEZI|nr:uncharacterized protein CLUP02_00967 [Colletotrichum lupini]UQC74319.1 hypothetical protein CLUP02_00967 [Colletotrichum lupini]
MADVILPELQIMLPKLKVNHHKHGNTNLGQPGIPAGAHISQGQNEVHWIMLGFRRAAPHHLPRLDSFLRTLASHPVRRTPTPFASEVPLRRDTRCVALRCVALRCVALRCVALRCVAFLPGLSPSYETESSHFPVHSTQVGDIVVGRSMTLALFLLFFKGDDILPAPADIPPPSEDGP